MTLSFKRAIVVGASSGIGEAIALELAREGAQVAILARRQAELERVAKSATGGGKLTAYEHDVTNLDSVPATFDRVVKDLGGVDLLVYSSGIMPGIVEGEYNFEKDRAMMIVNVLGAMAWMNPAAAHFEAARHGTIIGISSVAGERGRRGNPVYCTSKSSLTVYLESLRNRCSRYGVNVVTVKPGYVDTPMTHGLKGLFWLVSAEYVARRSLALARRNNSASGFAPKRWWLVALVLRCIPSFIFRRLNF